MSNGNLLCKRYAPPKGRRFWQSFSPVRCANSCECLMPWSSSVSTDPALCMLRADRYFSSFPKVGIVIPNPATWLLPEFQDLAATLSTTLSLPDGLLHGAYVSPTTDGFLINLPSCELPANPCCWICLLGRTGEAGWTPGRLQPDHMLHAECSLCIRQQP